MNAPLPADLLSAFALAAPTAAQHLRLALFGVIAQIIEAAGDADAADAAYAAVQTHPFLEDYRDEITRCVGPGAGAAARWRKAMARWLRQAPADALLPLRALARAGLTPLALELLLAAGLIEEDPRFGALFEAAQDGVAGERRPTFGLLMAWWRLRPRDDGSADHVAYRHAVHGCGSAHRADDCIGVGDIGIDAMGEVTDANGARDGESDGDTDSNIDSDIEDQPARVRHALLTLLKLGLLRATNPDAPRPHWVLTVPAVLWDALHGEVIDERGLCWRPHAELPDTASYLPAAAALTTPAALSALLRTTAPPIVLLRGPRHNGRGSFAGCVARALGKSLLLTSEPVFEDEARWAQFGVLAALLDALPVLRYELALGESRKLPPLPLGSLPLVIVTGRQGAWTSADDRALLAIDLPLPQAPERALHWRQALDDSAVAGDADALAAAFRLASGSIHGAARAAAALARLDGRDRIDADDARAACRALQSAQLETLATRLPARGGWHELAVDEATREELDLLAARCRHREALAASESAASGSGVRALLAGASGTGKTLAARLLAAELGKDLYRVDLAATVNKYLGETEKNLNRAFDAAEAMDVVLLLDEGDALMAQRTEVGSANDRYANLETNFLLQKIESFDGILLVTSNAAERIDRAFARRMDTVIQFRPPDEWRRYEILRLHLGDSVVDDGWLREAAARCQLAGGQWRNVVLHARLLALHARSALRAAHLHAALQREYRKSGASCPMRALAGAGV